MKASGQAIKASQVWDALTPALLREKFFDGFQAPVDDLSGVITTGTATNPTNLIDNDTGTNISHGAVDQYVQFDFGGYVYIETIRMFGTVGANVGNKFALRALIDGVFEDCLVDIPIRATADWSAWLELTTKRVARVWRFVITTYVATAPQAELELQGVRLGGGG